MLFLPNVHWEESGQIFISRAREIMHLKPTVMLRKNDLDILKYLAEKHTQFVVNNFVIITCSNFQILEKPK